MLDHPALMTAPSTEEVDATAGDPDPPATDELDTTEAERDIPPF